MSKKQVRQATITELWRQRVVSESSVPIATPEKLDEAESTTTITTTSISRSGGSTSSSTSSSSKTNQSLATFPIQKENPNLQPSNPIQPKKKKKLDAKAKRKQTEIRNQVEYYLSDENLKSDNFYRDKITSSKKGNGWIDIMCIMSAPRIEAKFVTVLDVFEALQTSCFIETMKEESDNEEKIWIRRKGGKALPKWEQRQKRKRYSDEYGSSYNRYHGYKRRNKFYSPYDSDVAEDLLCYGVKPWDDDASAVMDVIYGGY